jgi:hypothetical protein
LDAPYISDDTISLKAPNSDTATPMDGESDITSDKKDMD